jgi:ubiquinone/menaquinone biosynthesis C-methylase UbiE
LRQFDFSDADWLSYLATWRLPHLNDWMRGQAERGQEYYRSRLRRIRWGGQRVLDAGCGVGSWSIALASFFEEVYALENDAERLSVLEGMARHFDGRIKTQLGSVEKLPYADGTFDSVFCNGVIFVCDYRKALAEFARVLQPNGRLYVSYDGKRWWQHLLHERSIADPVCITYGANALISLQFRLLDEIGFEALVSESFRRQVQDRLVSEFPSGKLIATRETRLSRSYSLFCTASHDNPQRARLSKWVLSQAKACLVALVSNRAIMQKCAAILMCLDELSNSRVPPAYSARIAQDLLSRAVFSRSNYTLEIHTYSHEPEEMTEELRCHGFHEIQSASEGCLCLDPDAPAVKPIYDLRLGVFESLAIASSRNSPQFPGCADHDITPDWSATAKMLQPL